jgi:serine/threonine protein phosphatase PrpC
VRPDFHDFIILGCDGVFDRLTNQNALDMSWDVVNQLRASEIKNNSTKLTIHEVTGQIADQILT